MPSIVDAMERIGQLAPRIVRAPDLGHRVLFIGGHPGNGKTMMTPIISSLERMEIQRYNYVLEYLCSLWQLGRMESDVASAMIRMLTDLDIYNLMMSREVNFRYSDLSSVFQNPNGWRYVRRLFGAGDAAAMERIPTEQPILQLTLHYLLPFAQPLFEALGDRAHVLQLTRHPLYMIKQWHAYVHRHGHDVRDFTIWFDHEGQAVPFFARGWEEQFVRASRMDKAIYAIAHLFRMTRETLERLTEAERARVLIVPFEPFVLDPWPWLTRIEALVGTRVTPATRRELKRQRIPRRRIADGRATAIYRSYGWQPADRSTDERGELATRRAFAATEASPEAMDVLDRLSTEYEDEYLRGILPDVADRPSNESGSSA